MSVFPSSTAVLLAGLGLLAAGAVACGAALGGRIDPLAQVRGRLLAAIGAAALLLLACAALDDAVPEALGRPLAAAPAVAAAAALLTFGALPWRRVRIAGTRTAALQRRSIADAAGRRDVVGAAAAGAGLLTVLVVGGLTADPDGRSFTTTGAGWSGTASPYPGWFYGAPVAGSALLLAGAAVVALRRTALLPEVYRDAAQDRRWRRATGSVVLAFWSATVLLDLAGVLWSASGALRSTVSTGLLEGLAVDELLRVLLPAVGVGCGLCALAAAVLMATAIIRAATVGRTRPVRSA